MQPLGLSAALQHDERRAIRPKVRNGARLRVPRWKRHNCVSELEPGCPVRPAYGYGQAREDDIARARAGERRAWLRTIMIGLPARARARAILFPVNIIAGEVPSAPRRDVGRCIWRKTHHNAAKLSGSAGGA